MLEISTLSPVGADLLHQQGYRPAHFLPPEPIDELVPPRKDPNR